MNFNTKKVFYCEGMFGLKYNLQTYLLASKIGKTVFPTPQPTYKRGNKSY